MVTGDMDLSNPGNRPMAPRVAHRTPRHRSLDDFKGGGTLSVPASPPAAEEDRRRWHGRPPTPCEVKTWRGDAGPLSF